MIGDRKIIENHHIQKANFIYNSLPINIGLNKEIICIAGNPGTGKTEISLILQELLIERGITCYLLSIDDYYVTKWFERDKVRKETDIIGHKEINWNKINQITKNFKNNSSKAYTQRLNRFTNQLEHTRINMQKIDVLICEGLYALYINKFTFGYYLDATKEQTYKFRLKRGKEDPNDEFRQFVLEREEVDVLKSKKYANIIIPFGEER